MTDGGYVYTVSPQLVETRLSYDDSLISIYPKITTVTPPRYLGSNDLNKDKNIQDKIINYYYIKSIDKWLYNDFDELVDFFEVKNNKIKLVKNYKHKKSNDDKTNYYMILHFIEKAILTKKLVKKVIKEYIKLADINWYDMYYHSRALKDLLIHRLRKKIIKLIKHAQ